ncbi:hypothetical protein [Mitsuaria sp. BK037]|uniref:hypothetical protein n=1 Tax=Mitsuaria sp. BK037 TaxID=2587122 RepID=UPI001616BD27|nr:hypothetical protein [Mitsuaria sp. BK037]MBB3281868.1 hypothetical protein [Mitsuaria sp. BK037]
MNDLNVVLKIDRVLCRDEGDGPGNAEPYLWTVFFKADGDTLVVNTDGPSPPFLQGAPTVVGTPGNHGNLGTTDVDEGDSVPVPAIIGEYRTILKPIPLTSPLLGMTEVGGMIGCIVVLMEADETPNSAIALGHEALDRNVRDRLAEVLGTLSISKTEPSQEDIDAMTSQIGDAVESAIGRGVSVLDWIVGFGNMDDQIGSAVFRFSHLQLQNSGAAPIPFSRRWKKEGDWELSGRISAVPIPRPESKCCAELKQRLLALERVVAAQGKHIDKLDFQVNRETAVRKAKVRETVPFSQG